MHSPIETTSTSFSGYYTQISFFSHAYTRIHTHFSCYSELTGRPVHIWAVFALIHFLAKFASFPEIWSKTGHFWLSNTRPKTLTIFTIFAHRHKGSVVAYCGKRTCGTLLHVRRRCQSCRRARSAETNRQAVRRFCPGPYCAIVSILREAGRFRNRTGRAGSTIFL